MLGLVICCWVEVCLVSLCVVVVISLVLVRSVLHGLVKCMFAVVSFCDQVFILGFIVSAIWWVIYSIVSLRCRV